jgi:hypothetical protein
VLVPAGFGERGRLDRLEALFAQSSRHSATQSTCCSIDTVMFDRTEGLPGPVSMKKFGNPAVMSPRYVDGPAAHFVLEGHTIPAGDVAATRAPVMASKPVAYTMASKPNDSSAVSMPSSVMLTIGCLRRSTSRTCGRL